MGQHSSRCRKPRSLLPSGLWLHGSARALAAEHGAVADKMHVPRVPDAAGAPRLLPGADLHTSGTAFYTNFSLTLALQGPADACTVGTPTPLARHARPTADSPPAASHVSMPRTPTLPAEVLQQPAASLAAPDQVVCRVVGLVAVPVAQDQRGVRARLGHEGGCHEVADVHVPARQRLAPHDIVAAVAAGL